MTDAVDGVGGVDGVDGVDQLYALPPAEFVQARDELAKQLKAGGDAEAAKRVKQLRKPTAAAWAVNQLTRKHTAQLDELLELGERLQRAQARALGGGGAGTLKELLAERRATVERVARLAVGELGPTGQAQRDAIVATLEAALADPLQADAVRAGRLAKELPAPAGFGLADPTPLGTDGDHDDDGDEATATVTAAPADKERRRAQHHVDEKRGALRQAVEEADAAQHEHEAAQHELDRLEAQLGAARERTERATERRRLAERRAGAAAEELEAAEHTLRDMSREYRGSDAHE